MHWSKDSDSSMQHEDETRYAIRINDSWRSLMVSMLFLATKWVERVSGIPKPMTKVTMRIHPSDATE